ncbi:hypothetical protein [Streptomyces canus]|uniref:hypothetical protein n=1 Tax=Streptomyces canus TaxID=58343 RepID=UPI0027874396|nr:hypothetical protein [Streptomyces canus]MDQ0761109.1 uncharacterized protein (TIGR04222 family) [Streptomyces canus]
MTDWLVFACFVVITLTAWSLDGTKHGAAEDARREAFVADDRRSAVVTPDALRELGPVALELLDYGGAERVKLGVVARLVAERALRREPADVAGRASWRTRGPAPEGLDDCERDVLAAALPARDRWDRYLWSLPGGSPLAAEAETWLLGEGYLRRRGQPIPGGQRLRGWWSAAAAAAAVPTMALLALDHAWVRGGLVLFIGLMSLLVSAVPPAATRTMPHVTGKGELALSLAREQHAELNPATRPASQRYDPATVRMAVALFGWPVVHRIDTRIWDDWDRPSVDADGPGEGAF